MNGASERVLGLVGFICKSFPPSAFSSEGVTEAYAWGEVQHIWRFYSGQQPRPTPGSKLETALHADIDRYVGQSISDPAAFIVCRKLAALFVGNNEQMPKSLSSFAALLLGGEISVPAPRPARENLFLLRQVAISECVQEAMRLGASSLTVAFSDVADAMRQLRLRPNSAGTIKRIYYKHEAWKRIPISEMYKRKDG